MKTILILLFLLVPISAEAFDPWSRGDIAREVTWQVIHLVDWGQTLDISANGDRYHEINPILGRHPSRQEVNLYMGAGALLHVGITHILPKSYRPYWQYITLGLSTGCVINNFSIGLKVRF